MLAIQFAIWGAIGLDVIGLQIPILRQLIGFIYLTFVPGIIILKRSNCESGALILYVRAWMRRVYRKMVEELSWDKIADKTIEVYREVINEHKSKRWKIC